MGIGNNLIGDVERLLVDETIRSKSLFRFTKDDYLSYTFMFEKQVKEMFNSAGVLLLPSATTALIVFLKTLDRDEKNEAIIPPFSWVADYSALLFEQFSIRFCEVNSNLQITKKSIEKMITNKTKVVIIPHLMGRGQQEIEEISNLCRANDIILIEAIAQSFGVKVKGQYVGSFGDFSFCSLNHHKILFARRRKFNNAGCCNPMICRVSQ